MKHEDEKMQAIKRATVIYDGACPICSKTVAWMEEREQRGSFEMLPCQSESLGKRFPSVDRAACMRAMHVVLPDGSVLAGDQALPDSQAGVQRCHVLFRRSPTAGSNTHCIASISMVISEFLGYTSEHTKERRLKETALYCPKFLNKLMI